MNLSKEMNQLPHQLLLSDEPIGKRAPKAFQATVNHQQSIHCRFSSLLRPVHHFYIFETGKHTQIDNHEITTLIRHDLIFFSIIGKSEIRTLLKTRLASVELTHLFSIVTMNRVGCNFISLTNTGVLDMKVTQCCSWYPIAFAP